MILLRNSDRALSETFSLILIAFLCVAAAILLVASVSGVITNLLQKPAFMSVQAIPYDTGTAHIIGLFDQEGDAVNLNGTAETAGVSIVSITLIDPAGTAWALHSQGALKGNAWQPGQLLFIYQSAGSYVYSDVSPGAAAADLPKGTYTIRVTDDKAHSLIEATTVTLVY